jgi:hypothetical protein
MSNSFQAFQLITETRNLGNTEKGKRDNVAGERIEVGGIYLIS